MRENSADAIERQGYVQVADHMSLSDSRPFPGMIRHVAGHSDSIGAFYPKAEDVIEEVPEREAVRQTVRFLEDFRQVVAEDTAAPADAVALSNYAEMLEKNMVYMGEVELDEAARGLADYWQTYLADDPSHHIYVMASEEKSSGLFAAKIQSALPEEVQERVLTLDSLGNVEVEDESAALDLIHNAKVVLVDDWMATGRQMRVGYQQDAYPAMWSFARQHFPGTEAVAAALDEFNQRIEINVAIDAPRRIREGLAVSDGVDDVQVPVRAYYAGPNDEPITSPVIDTYDNAIELLVTGAHSSTDDGFEIPCSKMAELLNERYGQAVSLPPLANIARSYR